MTSVKRSRRRPACASRPTRRSTPGCRCCCGCTRSSTPAIAAAVRAEERRRGVRRACRSGCDVCCRTQSDIPVFQIELAGISWYSVEKLEGAARAAVRARLARPRPRAPARAPSSWSRPAPSTPCGRWPAASSPSSAAPAPRARTRSTRAAPTCSRRRRACWRRAYREMLPFHGVTDPKDQEPGSSGDWSTTLAVNLPTRDWRSLARLMDAAIDRNAQCLSAATARMHRRPCAAAARISRHARAAESAAIGPRSQGWMTAAQKPTQVTRPSRAAAWAPPSRGSRPARARRGPAPAPRAAR